jgi:hypothetical protein
MRRPGGQQWTEISVQHCHHYIIPIYKSPADDRARKLLHEEEACQVILLVQHRNYNCVQISLSIGGVSTRARWSDISSSLETKDLLHPASFIPSQVGGTKSYAMDEGEKAGVHKRKKDGSRLSQTRNKAGEWLKQAIK